MMMTVQLLGYLCEITAGVELVQVLFYFKIILKKTLLSVALQKGHYFVWLLEVSNLLLPHTSSESAGPMRKRAITRIMAGFACVAFQSGGDRP